MKISSRLIFLCLSLWLANIFWVTAQVESNKQPLNIILTSVENTFNIQFNYAEETIEGITIISPKAELNLDDTLAYLQNHTSLRFTKLDSQFILIQSRSPNTFCGFVKNRDEATPIPLATIQSEGGATVADQTGYFEIPITEGVNTLTIRSMGFASLQIAISELSKDSCIDIFLVSKIESLSEVYISNYITKGIDKMDNGSFSINLSDFEILPGLIENDILQTVQAFPGVQSVSETVSNINIRGGAHDQNLILWDHIKMYQSGHFFGLISMFNPQITQDVILYKNGTDVQFSDGVSGTIAMFTEKDLNNEFNGSLGANLIDVNGFADFPTGKHSSLQVAGRKSISDFAKTPTYNQFFERISQQTELENTSNNTVNSDKQFDFYDASLRWLYKISDQDELRLNFINASNKLVFNENSTVNTIETSRESNIKQTSIAGGLNYKRTWNNNFQTTLNIYETDYKLEGINANINESQRFLQKNQVSETSIKLLTDLKLRQNIRLATGYQFVETEITNLDDVDNPRFKSLISEVLREHSLFSQVSLKSENYKSHLNIGLRYSFIDKFQKHIFEPRISFTQRIVKNLSFEVLGEFKHQNTSQIINFQNDFLGIEKRRWQLSNNESIPIITSKQASFTLNFETNNFLISADTYYKYVNGITSQSQGFQNQYEFIKTIGHYDVYGLDFLIRKQLHKFNLWLSYAYMNNNYTFETLEDNSFPSNFDMTHTVTFGSALSTNKFKFSAGINWHTGKPITTPILNNPIENGSINYNSSSNDRLGSYFRFDLSALYLCNLGKKFKGRFGASIWNVLGNDNVINRYYKVSNSTVFEINEISLSFSPNITMRIYF